MAFDVVQISLFIKHETFAFNERNYLLKDVVGGQIDFVDENPVSIFDGSDEVAFEEAEDQIAVDFVQIEEDVVELLQHVLPFSQVATVHLLDDAGNGLDQRLQQYFGLPLEEVVGQIGQVRLVLLRPRHFRPELLQKSIEQLLQKNSAVDWFEPSNQISHISAAGHVVDVQFVSAQLRQVLDESGLAAASLTDEERVLSQLEADYQLLQDCEGVLRFDYFEERLDSVRNFSSADGELSVLLLEGDQSMGVALVGEIVDFELYLVHELLREEAVPQLAVEFLLGEGAVFQMEDALSQSHHSLPQLAQS